MADEKQRPRLFTEEPDFLQQRNDFAQLHPAAEEARLLHERAEQARLNPLGPQAREIEREKLILQTWERNEYRPLTPEQRSNVEKTLSEKQWSDSTAGSDKEKRTRGQRELDAHDRLITQRAAEAARDTLHDSGPGKEPGVYTVYEARDRAAHTPTIVQGNSPEPDR